MYAHSLKKCEKTKWEPLADHLIAVGDLAHEFASQFGFAAVAKIAGRLHDIGKVSEAYQTYISRPQDAENGRRGPDHSTASAREAKRLYGDGFGRMLAYIIAGHHAGLADFAELERRLDPNNLLEDYRGWEAYVGDLPSMAALKPTTNLKRGSSLGFSQSFLIRMLFSCLVDADFLATEAFYVRAERQTVQRGEHTAIDVLRDRLRLHMANLSSIAEDTAVNTWRARVLDHAIRKAALCPGFFTMTVPTGGGKTLASLSFALEHAVHHGMTRVIYVIPFTSIIEQTAEVFRQALQTQDDVLEHHASFDWEQKRKTAEADDEGPSGLTKLRKAAENWDVPIVVTTAEQFYESLFAARTSRCRKLHNLASAVIVLDEAQSLPLPVLRPALAALDELQRNYRASVVLCTATQPAWRKSDKALVDQQGHGFGLEIAADRELAPDPQDLYQALKRVKVEVLREAVGDDVIATRFAEQDQMLCIVNNRTHARSLYDGIADLPGATHLTTLMCPRHRRAVLADVRARLKAQEPVRLVATSLIEAGVDVDFPEVWRAAAGLDSIAQAAGRCNREGQFTIGRTVVFTPAEAKPPHALEAFWQATRPVLSEHEDVLSLAAVHAYFHKLYWQKGETALDAIKIDGRPGVLPALEERARESAFPFRSIAEAFRLIDDVMEPVFIPWEGDARALLKMVAQSDRPRKEDLRRLQQYVVSIPLKARDIWLQLGALHAVHPALGDSLLAFDDLAHYREHTGLDINDIGLRSIESNMM